MGILAYNSPDPVPKTITLEQGDGEARLIFPALPKWTGLFGVITSALAAGAFIFGAKRFVLLLYRMGIPSSSFWLLPALIDAAVPALCLMAVICTAAHFRRWRSTPKILGAARDELIWCSPGFWRLSQRNFAAADIESFEVLPVRDIFGRKTSFKLRCCPKRGRPIERVFTTRDPELPARVERAFRAALRLPS